jgi:hypothetical protein
MTDAGRTSKHIGFRRQTFMPLSRKDGSPFMTCAGTTRVVYGTSNTIRALKMT